MVLSWVVSQVFLACIPVDVKLSLLLVFEPVVAVAHIDGFTLLLFDGSMQYTSGCAVVGFEFHHQI